MFALLESILCYWICGLLHKVQIEFEFSPFKSKRRCSYCSYLAGALLLIRYCSDSIPSLNFRKQSVSCQKRFELMSV